MSHVNKKLDNMLTMKMGPCLMLKHECYIEFVSLKPMQVRCLEGGVDNDVLCMLSTGYGKSLIYEILPYYRKVKYNLSYIPKVVVVCPLNIILSSIEVKHPHTAKRIGDLMSNKSSRDSFDTEEHEHELQQISTDFTFLIGHPEQFLTNEAIALMRCSSFAKDVSHIVIDEAHCVVTWGSDFRPLYQQLVSLKSVFTEAKLIAMTGSATVSIERDIVRQLEMDSNVGIVRTSIDRSNIMLRVQQRQGSVGDSEETIFYDTLRPYLLQFVSMGLAYPKTVIFTRLDRCGQAHDEAFRLLHRNNPLRNSIAQYHAEISSKAGYLLVFVMQLVAYSLTRIAY